MLEKHGRYGIVLLLCLLLGLAGCAGLIEGKKTRKASSVVDFLYPGKADAVDAPQTPQLTLPLDVGIAFVPRAAAAMSATIWMPTRRWT